MAKKIKFTQISKKYEAENSNWISVPKNVEDYTQENMDNKFEGKECWKFLFKSLNKEENFKLRVLSEEKAVDIDDKIDTSRKQLDTIINNITDWENVKVAEILDGYEETGENGEKDDLEFSREAFDVFISKQFWAYELIIQSIIREVDRARQELKKNKTT